MDIQLTLGWMEHTGTYDSEWLFVQMSERRDENPDLPGLLLLIVKPPESLSREKCGFHFCGVGD